MEALVKSIYDEPTFLLRMGGRQAEPKIELPAERLHLCGVGQSPRLFLPT